MPLNMVFKALSDETRREILHMLQNGDLTAGEIADQFDMTRPSISHHLNILKQANLVQDVRKGQNICYSLNTTVFQDVIGWFYEMLTVGKKTDNINPASQDNVEKGEDYHGREK